MPEVKYLFFALVGAGLLTFCLRALPFLAIEKIRQNPAIIFLNKYLPAGIMTILAISTWVGIFLIEKNSIDSRRLIFASICLVITVAVHLLSGRKTIWSIATGTLCFVLLVNLA